jgi:hypothetical protein
MALVTAKMTHDPVSLRRLAPGLPSNVVEIVEKAMARDISRRYQTALEMRDAVVHALGSGDFKRAPETPTLRGNDAVPQRIEPEMTPRSGPSAAQTPSQALAEFVVSPPLAKPRRTAPRSIATAAGLVLLAGIVAVVVLTRGPSSPPKETPRPAEEITKPQPAPKPEPVAEAEPKPEPALSRVFLEVKPPDAKVIVDGKPHPGGSPHVLEGQPEQTLVVEVSADGYAVKREHITLATNDQRRTIALAPEEKPRAEKSAYDTIRHDHNGERNTRRDGSPIC